VSTTPEPPLALCELVEAAQVGTTTVAFAQIFLTPFRKYPVHVEISKSQKFLNENTRLFHQNFDEAFLNIYPDFISEVNRLLADGNKITEDDGSEPRKQLTTELRILALLRLGISDNQKIADILRSSITTIYTYRSKLKARAIQRDTFEDNVKQISTY